MNKITTKMPTPDPKLLSKPLHKRIARESWTFRTPMDKLPGTKYGKRQDYTWKGKNGNVYVEQESSRFNFIDNGGSILIVAHTDSVVATPHVIANSHVIASPVIDNRIGVWLALCELPRHGIVADILLTEGEETGQSTAAHFSIKNRQYNWIAEFDRMGFDCALYQYGSAETAALVESIGYTAVGGSFTDICSLTHLGCKGFNFGVGYRDYHSERAHIVTSELDELIKMFVKFYNLYKDVAMPHDPKRTTRTWYPKTTWQPGGKYGDWTSLRKGDGKDWGDWHDWHDHTRKPGDAQYYKGQDKYGYLDDGQAGSNEALAPYPMLPAPKTKKGKADKSKKLTSEDKLELYFRTIGTSKELDTLIECDGCGYSYRPGQLIWDQRIESLICDNCDVELTDIERTDRLYACQCCGQNADVVKTCKIEGQAITLCDNCIYDWSKGGFSIQQ